MRLFPFALPFTTYATLPVTFPIYVYRFAFTRSLRLRLRFTARCFAHTVHCGCTHGLRAAPRTRIPAHAAARTARLRIRCLRLVYHAGYLADYHTRCRFSSGLRLPRLLVYIIPHRSRSLSAFWLVTRLVTARVTAFWFYGSLPRSVRLHGCGCLVTRILPFISLLQLPHVTFTAFTVTLFTFTAYHTAHYAVYRTLPLRLVRTTHTLRVLLHLYLVTYGCVLHHPLRVYLRFAFTAVAFAGCCLYSSPLLPDYRGCLPRLVTCHALHYTLPFTYVYCHRLRLPLRALRFYLRFTLRCYTRWFTTFYCAFCHGLRWLRSRLLYSSG